MLIHVHLVLIPLLLTVSALFAASEASLLSLNRAQLETLRQSRPGAFRLIHALISKPEALLSTIVVGNELLNIMLGTLFVELLEFHFKNLEDRWLVVLSVVVSSAFMLPIAEILPRVLAFRLPILVSSILVFPMTVFHKLLTPPRKIFLFVSEQITRFFGIQTALPAAVNEKDFLTLVEVGTESGSLNRDEKEMITNVFHFSDLPVSAVMTPWATVFSMRDGLPVDQVISLVKQKTFSRIPIVSERDDRVVGILYTKELLKFLLHPDPKPTGEALKSAIFLPYIVSSHKKVSKLFREFKTKKVHIALVVDEYGKQMGVVTLEDLLNSLFKTQRKPEGTRT